MTYTQRLNYFTKPRTWEAGEDRLRWREEDSEGEIPFGDIVAVRLKYAPTRTERSRVLLRIQTKTGVSEISNIDWQGPLSSTDQKDEFIAFVDLLHARIAAAGVEVEFASGSSMGAYVGNWILTVFVGLVIIGAGIFLLVSGMFVIVLIKVLLILFYLPTLFRFLKRNYPCRYDPNTVPWQRIIS